MKKKKQRCRCRGQAVRGGGSSPLKRRGLIIQPGAIGDVILTLPLVRLMKRQPWVGEVDMMGRLDYLAMLEGRTEVSRVISLESVPLHGLFTDSNRYPLDEYGPLATFFQNYDLIATFLGDEAGHFEKNLIHTTAMTHPAEVISLELRPPESYPHHSSYYVLEQYLRHFQGMEVAIENDCFEGPLIRLGDKDRERFAGVLSGSGLNEINKAIAIHPGSGGAKKCWDLDNYRTLAGNLRQKGYQPIFLWGPAEQDRWGTTIRDRLGEEFSVVSNRNLDEIALILSHCRGYVGNDSGITHLAGALGVTTLAIFGVTESRHWGPLGPRSVICKATDMLAEGQWPGVDNVLARLAERLS